jgi:hypothetical protein
MVGPASEAGHTTLAVEESSNTQRSEPDASHRHRQIGPRPNQGSKDTIPTDIFTGQETRCRGEMTPSRRGEANG